MILAGFQKTSLVDWPGQICATIFTAGCNFRCPYCHNPELVLPELIKDLEPVQEDDIIVELHRRAKLLDGVCITGGEPLMHPEIETLIRKIKKIGLKVKIDTNGTNPVFLEKLLKSGLVDYVAMDIKAPINRYQEATRTKIDTDLIERSVKTIIKSGIDHEFRTTVMPGIVSPQDIEHIAEWIKEAKAYYLQQFTFDSKMLDPKYEKTTPYTPDQLKEMLKKVSCYHTKTGIRGI